MDNSGNYLLFIVAWLSWCGLHSFLICPPVLTYLEKLLGETFRFYRLSYNLVSLITLAFPAFLGLSLQQSETAVFVWSGIAGGIRILLLGFALILFISAGRHYDMSLFLGLTQVRSRRHGHLVMPPNVLTISGVSAIVRHPWYLGGILFVWSAAEVLYPSTVITAVILSGYFVTGTILEERKLVRKFGDSYRVYQHDVSMLFPVKWLCTVLRINKNNGN